jgi:hypothetical protein
MNKVEYWPAGDEPEPRFLELLTQQSSRSERYTFLGWSGNNAARRLSEETGKKPTDPVFVLANPWDDKLLHAGYDFSITHFPNPSEKLNDHIGRIRREICQTIHCLLPLSKFEIFLCSTPLYSRFEIFDNGLFIGNYGKGPKTYEDRFFLPENSNEYRFRKHIAEAIISEAISKPWYTGDETDLKNLKGSIKILDQNSSQETINHLMEQFAGICKNDAHCCKGYGVCWAKNLPGAGSGPDSDHGPTKAGT